MQPLGFMADNTIIDMCNNMDINSLENFILDTEHNYNLCHEILRNKRLYLKDIILDELEKIGIGYYLDVTNITPCGTGTNTILHYGRVNKIKIPGYSVVVSRDRYQEIVDIMNTD